MSTFNPLKTITHEFGDPQDQVSSVLCVQVSELPVNVLLRHKRKVSNYVQAVHIDHGGVCLREIPASEHLSVWSFR
jgi:hypothetical protein